MQATQSACPAIEPNNLGVNTSDSGFSFANGVCNYVTNRNLLPVGVEVGSLTSLSVVFLNDELTP